MEEKKLKVKDLVNIGIFSALYMVVTMIAMMPAGLHPVIWLMWPGIAGILAGAFYTILMVKAKKPGSAFLLMLITGLLYFATGECTWVIVVTTLVAGVVAEVVRKILGYDSFKGIALSGGVAAVGLIGSPLPMWLFQESYSQSIIDMGMSPEYVANFQTMISPMSMAGMIVFALIGGIIGTLIGKKLLKKHFEKAGIV